MTAKLICIAQNKSYYDKVKYKHKTVIFMYMLMFNF